MTVFALQLCVSGHSESILYRLPKGSTLRFVQSSQLAARGGVVDLLFNQSAGADVRFSRASFTDLLAGRKQDPKDILSGSDWHVDVELHTSGSCHYKFAYKGGDGDERVELSGYVVVEPDLRLPDGSSLSLDAVSMQTVMAPILGPLAGWRSRLEVAHQSGYNMVHFSPIQQLGESQSAYSIADQLQLLNETRDVPLEPGQRPDRLITQSSVGKLSASMQIDVGMTDVYALIKQLHTDWGMFCLVDVVWNHTASDSAWLRDHPEAGYNLKNSPHLKPAYDLNRVIMNFSREIAEGKWRERGVSEYINSEDDIRRLADTLRHFVLPSALLWEYFSVDVDAQADAFSKRLESQQVDLSRTPGSSTSLTIIQDPQYGRFTCSVDLDLAVDLLFHRDMQERSLEEHVARARKDFADTLHWLNDQKRREIEQDLYHEVVHNCMATVRYEHVEQHGPRSEKVTVDHTFVPSYFFHLDGGAWLSEEEVQDAEKGERVLSHNGWVMGADPLVNFASARSQVFLRRQLLPWCDSCKLRYGEEPADSLWLWEHMTAYTRQMARCFHGFRIDNCHNTPIHVAEYLLDEARLVRPELYVVAELFTDSESTDNIFINRLGINSLIREAAHAPNSQELGRLVFRFGGQPVGSFSPLPGTQRLKPSVAHALFVDQTHDNETLIKTRSVYDILPNSALVCMASCAVGSTRGYDELVAYAVGVVGNGRLYTDWSAEAVAPAGSVSADSGIIAAKRALNDLHARLAADNFSQIYVDQVSEAIVSVTRHNPDTHESVVLVAHTSFMKIPDLERPTEEFIGVSGYVPPLCVQGVVDEVVLEGQILRRVHSPPQALSSDPSIVQGLPDFKVDLRQHIGLDQSRFCNLRCVNQEQEVHFHAFPPGSVIAFKTSLRSSAQQAAQVLRNSLGQLRAGAGPAALCRAVGTLSLTDMSHALYRCDAEERDDGNGVAVYDVPRHGPFKYSGLQGVMSLLEVVHSNNDLGHPVCDNIRAGDWLAGYVCDRLRHHQSTQPLGEHLRALLEPLSQLPRYLVPTYFHQLLYHVHALLVQRAVKLMSPFVQGGSQFIKRLALGSVQLYSVVKSSSMPALAPDLAASTGTASATADLEDEGASLAAGLPHFATGVMRCWGRDTFIALRGLMMVTGRLPAARRIILAFAACLRHGLIPNLLGGGPGARFNCRDAPWWFLQAIQDYTTFAGDLAILDDPVARLFPTDDSPPQTSTPAIQPLSDVIQEILQRHATGIAFRERNAGRDLDMNMSHEGFDVSARIDWTTGFPQGGSPTNCGTWMDKVGESDQGQNRGVPATPRDGSAVEIVGLCKSAASWLARLHKSGDYAKSGVEASVDGNAQEVSFSRWADKIQANFEKRFWVPESSDTDVEREGEDAKFIHRRAIYKDTVGASKRFADFQLRPNFPVAMVVAPELFTPSNAVLALDNAETVLNAPLGMATLDPKDWAYNGVYDNSIDSHDFGTARGFNYHQGPEWLWIKGYYLRARYRFLSQTASSDSARRGIYHSLARLQDALTTAEWQGLPELTNANGADCKDSCPVQAWSMSSLLDLLYDMSKA